MMILKLRSFHRWARREGVSDVSLKKAVAEMIRGLVEGDLGAGLFKKRVPREGEGKRGGFRTMIAFRRDDRSIFILGYPKSATDNIGDDELLTLKKLARELLSASDAEIRKRILAGDLVEIK